MANDIEKKTGLFIASYDIGTGLAGAPNLHLDLAINAVDRVVTGHSRVTQAINPPTDVRSKLTGDFTYMTVMPQQTRILVSANGVLALWQSHNGGVGIALPHNLVLRMVLESDWKSGIASYKYLVGDTWHEVNDVPVTAVAESDSSRSFNPGSARVLYGVSIQQAVASGDLAEMRRLEKEAEVHLSQYGDMQSALANLRSEIARAERKA